MKIKNKKTDEVIDLSVSKKESSAPTTKKPYLEKVEERTAKAEQRIEKRGDIVENIKRSFSGKTSGKLMAGIESLSAPFQSLESGIANPALAMQRGEFDPRVLARESALGFSGKRQGQYGDVLKIAGVQPQLADAMGMLLAATPFQVANKASQTFGNISKLSDKGLKKAGTNIIQAVNEAKHETGTKVAQAFQQTGVNNLPVNGMKLIDLHVKLPEIIQKKLVEKFGEIDVFAQNLTAGSLREFKTYLGKLRPNDFGKDAKGLAESIEAKDLNIGYGAVKELLWDTVSKSGIKKQVADHLKTLDNTYSAVIKAGRAIKGKIVDSRLQQPTKAGSFSEEVLKSSDQTARVAMSEIKRASQKANSLINKSMEEMKRFQSWQTTKNVSSHIVKAAAFGGIAGGIGGKILNTISVKE